MTSVRYLRNRKQAQVFEVPSAKDGAMEDKVKETGRGLIYRVWQAMERALGFILWPTESPLHY